VNAEPPALERVDHAAEVGVHDVEIEQQLRRVEGIEG
jgi:hypothetical protein